MRERPAAKALQQQEQRHFNPRSLAGATVGRLCNRVKLKIISIHAPLRERPQCSYPPAASGYFNPRSLAGATGGCQCRYRTQRNFNPRSLAGATREWSLESKAKKFQSTLPCGSDPRKLAVGVKLTISIHAPLRERRSGNCWPLPLSIISIHAPLRERRSLVQLKNSEIAISIHAPLRERRSCVYPWTLLRAYFNPRSLAGATRDNHTIHVSMSDFNPRSLAGATLSLSMS